MADSPSLSPSSSVSPSNAYLYCDYYSNFDAVEGMSSAYSQYHAQSFTGDGNRLDHICFYMYKGGSPTGTVNAYLWAHSGSFGSSSVPSTLLATADSQNIANWDNSNYVRTFMFTGGNRITLANGTKYCVGVNFSGGDGSNYLSVYDDQTGSTHAGNSSYFNGSSWVANPTKDFWFYVFTFGGSSSLSPSSSSSPSLSPSGSLSPSSSNSPSSSPSLSPSSSVSPSLSPSSSSSPSYSPSSSNSPSNSPSLSPSASQSPSASVSPSPSQFIPPISIDMSIIAQKDDISITKVKPDNLTILD